jgi:hypothetical protein
MTGSTHTHVTPDLPPEVEAPDLPGDGNSTGGAGTDGDCRDGSRNRGKASRAADGRAEESGG